ncbi:Fc.00g045270.m01.CDS01 [Cosmosporella sp. VM-42]
MLRRVLFTAASVIAILAILLGTRRGTPEPPPIIGRNNTVLFITDSANGLSNVHLATSFALVERHPSIELHYASYERLALEVSRISATATAKNPAAKAIIWHELPGPDLTDSLNRAWGGLKGIITPPGLEGIDKLTRDVQILLAPWEAEDHWKVYQAISQLIADLDPGVVVLDSIFRPAMEATRDLNRKNVVLSPNTLTDALAQKQPWGAMFWKYPPIGSGFPYPVPWKLIPTAIYLQVRLIYAALVAPNVAAKRTYLKEKGVKNPLDITHVHRPDAPWLSMSFPEACLPMAIIPDGTAHCGPAVLETASVEEQDAELAAWLSKAPTMLVNLGSSVKYDEDRAHAMVGAFLLVLEKTDTQILWKMRRTAASTYDDSYLQPVQQYITEGRLRLETWFMADPTSILMSGHVVVSVHHGGANCYHETVYAGIPQVVLPLWFDLYNYAATAEYRGVGIWPGKETAPIWDADSLARGFMQALVGNSSDSMRKKAKELAKIARQYGGRDKAAMEIANIAATGHG